MDNGFSRCDGYRQTHQLVFVRLRTAAWDMGNVSLLISKVLQMLSVSVELLQ